MNEIVELIVGPRFRFTREDMEEANNPMHFPGLRGGRGPTTIIDWMPVSGPIVRREVWSSRDGKYRWRAVCMNGFCLQGSKEYKKKNDVNLFKWASDHRCPPVDWRFVVRPGNRAVIQKLENGHARELE